MMEWQEEGIFLHQEPFGESKRMVTVLTATHGKWRALVRGNAKSHTAIFPGAQMHIMWRGSGEEQLGNFQWDEAWGLALMMGTFPGALRIIALMCSLCFYALPDRMAFPKVYGLFLETSRHLMTPYALQAYSAFEVLLMRELGHDLPGQGYHQGAGVLSTTKDSPKKLLQQLKHRYAWLLGCCPWLKPFMVARDHFIQDLEKILYSMV